VQLSNGPHCKHSNDSAREGLLTNHSVPKLSPQAESPVDNVGEAVLFVVPTWPEVSSPELIFS
jgi:hypothetical protein